MTADRKPLFVAGTEWALVLFALAASAVGVIRLAGTMGKWFEFVAFPIALAIIACCTLAAMRSGLWWARWLAVAILGGLGIRALWTLASSAEIARASFRDYAATSFHVMVVAVLLGLSVLMALHPASRGYFEGTRRG